MSTVSTWSLNPTHWRDRIDHLRARRLRAALGRRRWLVSWNDNGAAPRVWRARVSCPQLDITVERCGSSRCQAISFARSALQFLLSDSKRERVPNRPHFFR